VYLSPEFQRYVDKEKQQVSHRQAGQKQAESKLFLLYGVTKKKERREVEAGR
jgi:hypothetical protein